MHDKVSVSRRINSLSFDFPDSIKVYNSRVEMIA